MPKMVESRFVQARRFFPRTNSILMQIRLTVVWIAISSALIIGAVLDQSNHIDTMVKDHAKVDEIDQKVNDLNNVVSDVRSLSMALASTGNNGPNAEKRQVELFAKVNKAGAMGARISNVSPEYARIVSPYELEKELGAIANQVMAIENKQDGFKEEEIISDLEKATVYVSNRVLKLIERAKAQSAASQAKLQRAIVNVILTIFIACGLNFAACAFMARHLLIKVAKPAEQIAKTTEALADGQLNISIPQTELTELNAIAQALEKFRASAFRERRQALEDISSGLPNRRAFIQKIEQLVEEKRGQIILVYLDVDRFKDINDSYGHSTGDRLIKAIGQRLQDVVPDNELVARVGGDEFAVILKTEVISSVYGIGKDLVEAMHDPFDCGNCSLAATTSIGITLSATDKTAEQLMHEADVALYHAKASGRDQYAIYSPSMAEADSVMRQLERDLPQAIHGGQFSMKYQPIFNTKNPDKRELEALARWQHPELGAIKPDVFINIAEQSGMITLLGEWIIDRTFSDMQSWPDVKVSINLSPIQLKSANFLKNVMDAAAQYNITPQRVEFEITESMNIENSERAVLTLGLLRSSGFRIALDDFGSGYSSLAFIKNYPLDRIKLDRSLLKDIGAGGVADAVLEAAIAIGARLNLEIVAEGVEKIEQVEVMKKAGCSHLQGFYFSRPLATADVEPYFQGHSKESADDSAGGSEHQPDRRTATGKAA